ncbi:2,3-bisphosphoglycerate-independent phosphoglycerate mutase [Phaeovibrio sulfidiphilus]|uniref:2,3-bisphosphoglycerate-independent phosphoglycerate mutase n=1 Tax=Phaeovibrio sulfidiphilus TaxID=1220600 RepID=A0A8J7CCK4_9PROT|nr:2,3-bisphosphoglycerate-independent phosphoglycerate mutase [Phaeovibrio sulfidiphilus]MBE1237308.1 2,3-bisphosphoglycerate-independent phosphoglycerate mutase [Phaeovibrio sulfidiphilus]
MTGPTRKTPRPMVLCILDGWGHREDKADNAIALARTPTWDHLYATCPRTLIQTSGLAVGLPEGQMGNSEVGHMNMGAGRVVMQELPRIDQAVQDGSYKTAPAMVDFVANMRASGGTAHVMGLVSPGGVHSHQKHMSAMARYLAEQGIPVKVHAFLDGRDTPPRSAPGFLKTFMEDAGDQVPVVTVTGRFYAMDRDNRWDRVEQAWKAMVRGEGQPASDAISAVESFYATHDKGDEFVIPAVIGDYRGMADGDGIFCVNFRSDRAREITRALLQPGFACFPVANPKFAAAMSMTEYSAEHNAFMSVLFPPESLKNILGQVLADHHLTQLRLAETEKYAHVTFFFNGGQETCFEGEERILVPSPKVPTYDLQPEMSAPEVAGKLVEAIESGRFDVIIVNFANGDMVGHTGILEAAEKAAEAVDAALSRVVPALEKVGGSMLLTADHGNAELMRDPETGQPYTAHTTFPVDLLLINAPEGVGLKDGGRLADLAPTLLDLIQVKQPAEMTGRSLLRRD